MVQQHFNAIPQELIQACINDYYSRDAFDTSTMNKAEPGHSLQLLLPTIQKYLGPNVEFRSGNFYKHSLPYFPHTDFKVNQNNNINVVIPLEFTGTQASLVVFDQRWEHDSVTWCLDRPVMEFKVNTGVPGNPCDYDVIGLTNKDIDDNLYSKYLSKYGKQCFFGLSGKAYPYEVGSMIIFDNRLIHATSTYQGEKMGITLRFEAK